MNLIKPVKIKYCIESYTFNTITSYNNICLCSILNGPLINIACFRENESFPKTTGNKMLH